MSFGVWENNVALSNQIAQLVVVLVHERRSASHHLVNQDSQSPPIDCEIVSFHIQYLRSEILRCSTKRFGILVWLQELRKPKISKFNVARLLYKNVFGLQVAVNNFIGVQVS